VFFVATFASTYLLTSCFSGICLDPVAENHRVSERVATLERVSSDTNTFWIDARRRGASCRIMSITSKNLWMVAKDL
jgi:hypothetical protein